MTHPVSSSTESKALRIGDPEITDWIPVFTGMTHPVSSSTESEALRIGDPEITDWIPVFTGMTHSLSSSTESPLCHPRPDRGSRQNDWIPACAGMTSGTRITTDKLSITTKNPTGQAPRYSLFCYLKWLHPVANHRVFSRLEISGNFA